jgi:hypothetical protein
VTIGRARYPLLHDAALVLESDACLGALAEAWLPSVAVEPLPPMRSDPSPARIDLSVTALAPPPPAGPSAFRAAGVEAWLTDGGPAVLRGADPEEWASIHLEDMVAQVSAPAQGAQVGREGSVFHLLDVSAALLMGRLGRTFLHAAAVARPGEGAWLLVGDSCSGKTTTTLNLMGRGWSVVSDDAVVVFQEHEGGPVWIEGWPRRFGVDEGWERGEVTGRRSRREPGTFATVNWQRSAPLAGLVFPRIMGDAPTCLQPASAARALERLIRQSPWLMADRSGAPRLLRMFRSMVEAPLFELSLGRDTYRDAGKLEQRLAPLLMAGLSSHR